mmetsp:Transcript_52625/g.132249  ORF Transcript_52625/g.132249 Transcript_52625/m.132249 type:complete len:88 (-) Transcript_52625:445-708(-)
MPWHAIQACTSVMAPIQPSVHSTRTTARHDTLRKIKIGHHHQPQNDTHSIQPTHHTPMHTTIRCPSQTSDTIHLSSHPSIHRAIASP